MDKYPYACRIFCACLVYVYTVLVVLHTQLLVSLYNILHCCPCKYICLWKFHRLHERHSHTEIEGTTEMLTEKENVTVLCCAWKAAMCLTSRLFSDTFTLALYILNVDKEEIWNLLPWFDCTKIIQNFFLQRALVCIEARAYYLCELGIYQVTQLSQW